MAQEHAGTGRGALNHSDTHELRLVGAATLANLAVATALLAVAGSGVAGTELALRITARVSFVWFMMGFLASPLEQLRPSRLSA